MWHICPLFNEENFAGKKENLYSHISSFNMVALPRGSDVAITHAVEVPEAAYHPLRTD